MTDLSTPYNGTGGYVERPASRERAEQEAADGTLSARQTAVLAALHECGVGGATWREIGTRLGLHHGQVSGCLSNLHTAGKVTMLRRTANRCHIYVHADYKYAFGLDERWDQPARTKTGTNRERLEHLRHVCQQAVVDGWTYDNRQQIVDALRALDTTP